jgi:hypothetical protein
MIIWIVQQDGYEEGEVVGVFTNESVANAVAHWMNETNKHLGWLYTKVNVHSCEVDDETMITAALSYAAQSRPESDQESQSTPSPT